VIESEVRDDEHRAQRNACCSNPGQRFPRLQALAAVSRIVPLPFEESRNRSIR
jgi:hypothetical protein